MKDQRLTTGYTLVEILFYIGLLALIMIVAVNTIIVTSHSFASVRSLRAVNTSGEAAMERLAREIKLADSIDTASVFDVNPGILKLNGVDAISGSAQTITFTVSGNKVQVQEGAGAAEDITGANVSVSNLVFRKLVGTTSPAVRVEMTVGGYNFYATAVLRRAY